MAYDMSYSRRETEILTDIWKNAYDGLSCPQCGKRLILVQVEPIQDLTIPYIPYDTVIECTSCDFNIHVESFSILGCVKDFNVRIVDIASWSPSGSRVVSSYEHVLPYDQLKKLKESGELVEFLVVNKHVVQIIG